MKNLTLILFFAFLIACQTKTQNESSNTMQIRNFNTVPIIKNVNETNEAKTSVSPTSLTNKTNDIDSKIGNIQSGEKSACLKI